MLFFGVDFSGQSSQESYSIKVNDHVVPLDGFYQRRREYQESLYRMFGAQYPQVAARMLENAGSQITDQMITETILREYAEGLGMAVSDKQLAQQVAQMFQGNFSLSAYQAFLQQAGYTAPEFEDRVRGDVLRQQLSAVIRDSTRLSAAELHSMRRAELTKIDFRSLPFQAQSFVSSTGTPKAGELEEFFQQHAVEYEAPERVKYDYLVLAPDEFLDLVEVAPEDIEFFYTDHEKEYREPEQVLIREIVLKPKSSSEGDRTGTRSLADELHGRLEKGEEFGQLAKKYSDDREHAQMAGQVGWVTKGQRPEAVEQEIFSLKDGGLSSVIETPNAFYIVYVDEYQPVRIKPLEEVRDQIEKTIREREAPAYTSVKAQELYDTWAASPDVALRDFAGKSSLVSHSSDTLLAAPEDPKGLAGLTRKVLSDASQERQIIELGNKAVLVEVLEHQEEQVPELATVHDKVLQDWKESRAQVLAKNAMEETLEALRSSSPDEANMTLEAISKKYGLTVQEEKGITRNAPGPVLSSSDEAKRAVFGPVSDGEIFSRSFLIQGVPTLVQVLRVQPPSEEEVQKELESFRERAESQVASNVTLSLVSALKSKATIEVNPALYGS